MRARKYYSFGFVPKHHQRYIVEIRLFIGSLGGQKLPDHTRWNQKLRQLASHCGTRRCLYRLKNDLFWLNGHCNSAQAYSIFNLFAVNNFVVEPGTVPL